MAGLTVLQLCKLVFVQEKMMLHKVIRR